MKHMLAGIVVTVGVLAAAWVILSGLSGADQYRSAALLIVIVPTTLSGVAFWIGVGAMDLATEPDGSEVPALGPLIIGYGIVMLGAAFVSTLCWFATAG